VLQEFLVAKAEASRSQIPDLFFEREKLALEREKLQLDRERFELEREERLQNIQRQKEEKESMLNLLKGMIDMVKDGKK
jgi:hypothetical protein